MLLYAALLLPLGLALAGAGVGALQAGEALDAERFCAAGRTEDVIERVAGVLDGPHHQRGPGDEWWVRPHAEASCSTRTSTAGTGTRSRRTPARR
jgi:hypothetical protein